MEIWDLYDQDRNKIGKTHVRGVPVPEGCYHLVVHVWVQNDRGEILLSKRHPNKPYGNLWECTGGSVLSGETSLEGALRETEEELGLVLQQKNGKILRRELRGNHHLDVWYFRANESIKNLTLQPEEVVDAKWVNRDTYEEMLANNELVPSIDRFFDLVSLIK
ncbi:NUDIX domain-containing protein [Caldibacillus lycopersici]|uniref:NUDIX domain-containing protein n=1 Tax=Perspicuibacillus lycopersici TaxID=1325689 RepID=A0AAE3IT02_9BACI|nr:NUDIX domain-containing protein [Perspicuibacillus lycopersici]MCU9612904.1 NUDIX domain-containing protein [Perspicuibacillus lycopersici]